MQLKAEATVEFVKLWVFKRCCVIVLDDCSESLSILKEREGNI